ncbi:hypothetical protein GUJ93_ZPchr0002g26628 [Zizania palustris]|uniref:Uncharacterized protein n=1 Tax=Zizania palustris TaxID=103762 RepID=A0A8J5S6G2_ZIZPA|nr:hypothetical protein GUJ93_ZPchr0002g26628 [Zizania palustris]
MKDQVHSALIRGADIFQTKSHDDPLEQTDKTRASKGSLVDVLFGHKDLIITSIAIKKT